MDEGEIRRFIQANLKYFGPEGLGWPRPGGLPKYYAQHPEEWPSDLAQVEDLRRRDAARAKAEQMARTRTAAADQSGGGATASSGMSDDTKRLFREINQLSLAGRQVEQISEQLLMPERCVRNALALRHNADSPHAGAPDHGPEVGRYLGANYRWPGVNGRSNGNGNPSDHGLRGGPSTN